MTTNEYCKVLIVDDEILIRQGMDGEELTKLIKLHYPNIEVIVLSSFGETLRSA